MRRRWSRVGNGFWRTVCSVLDSGLMNTGAVLSPPTRSLRRAVLEKPDFFLLRTAPRDHQPPTTNRRQPPTANHQPPPTGNRQPPTATNHQDTYCGVSSWERWVPNCWCRCVWGCFCCLRRWSYCMARSKRRCTDCLTGYGHMNAWSLCRLNHRPGRPDTLQPSAQGSSTSFSTTATFVYSLAAGPIAAAGTKVALQLRRMADHKMTRKQPIGQST